MVLKVFAEQFPTAAMGVAEFNSLGIVGLGGWKGLLAWEGCGWEHSIPTCTNAMQCIVMIKHLIIISLNDRLIMQS